MGKKSKYTYKDWWKGRVCSSVAEFIPPKDEGRVISCAWDDFETNDVQRIKDKQVELFELRTKEWFEKFKNIFSKGYKNSELKSRYLNNEIDDFQDIAFTKIPPRSDNSYEFRNGPKYFEPNNLPEIRFYIREIIVKGRKRNYDKVHSPNFLYQPAELSTIEMYAQACWDYFKWLISFRKRIKREHDQDTESDGGTPGITEKLHGKLKKFAFFDLPPVVALSRQKQKQLVRLIASSGLPYKIAMLEFLGFTTQIEKVYSATKAESYLLLSDILGFPLRSVKGNMLVLNPNSKENRTRYTSCFYEKDVEKDYQKLK